MGERAGLLGSACLAVSTEAPSNRSSAAFAVVPKATCHYLKTHLEDALEPCFLCQIPQMADNQVWAVFPALSETAVSAGPLSWE